jgi:L-cysteine:1D-myo-inositol 2-amino-2-deoxy-alpha-D-glucopyranoside ligase
MKSWPSLYVPETGEIHFPELVLKADRGLGSYHDYETIHLYVCGITPYDATHLGHAATYLTFDMISRYLRATGKKVRFVENITDIDDPLFERANRDNISWQSLAHDQVDLFRSDMTALHILPPESFVAVTEVMPLVESAINQLRDRGFTYQVDGDTYFDISTFLPDLPISYDLALSIFAQRGGDPKRPGKRDPLDPLLWLAKRPGEPSWPSSHGEGRPGWHIECSIIALRYLLGEEFLRHTGTNGSLIEIQGGGSDLIFPHHFMSGAQAQALTGTAFARSYIHAGMVGLDGEKMSKSLGNLVFVSKLLAQGRDAMAIRYALLLDHYSQDRMWSDEILQRAEREIGAIRSALSREELPDTSDLIDRMNQALANDLDTPLALSELYRWTSSLPRPDDFIAAPGAAGRLSRYLDAVLGLAL